MDIPFDRFLRSFYTDKLIVNQRDSHLSNRVRLETRLKFEEEKLKWMKQLEAERAVHSRIVGELRAELKQTTSQKNFRIGKLVSELYSANKSVKDLKAELQRASMEPVQEKVITDRLFIQEEVASTLKNVIESVVSNKKVSLDALKEKLLKEEEHTHKLDQIIRDLKAEKCELQSELEQQKSEAKLRSEIDLKNEVFQREDQIADLKRQLILSKKEYEHAIAGFDKEREDLRRKLTDEEKTVSTQSEKNLQSELQKLEAKLKNDFALQFSRILNEKDGLQLELNSLNYQLTLQTEKLEESRRENKVLEESFNDSKGLTDEVQSLKNKMGTLLGQLDDSKLDYERSLSKLQENINRHEEAERDVKKILLSHNMDSENVLFALRQHFDNFNTVSGNLKEYEAQIESLRNSLKDYEAQNDEVRRSNAAHLTSLTDEKNKEIGDLKTQLSEIPLRKESIAMGDTASEIGSTCSMSRTDEHERLADCEGYFEERYTKLKVLAVKLKRKVFELEAQRKVDKEKILVSNNNLSNVQAAFDKLGEELQEKKSLIKVIESDLKKSVEELVLSKQKIMELQEELSSSRDVNETMKAEAVERSIQLEGLTGEVSILKERDECSTKSLLELKKKLSSYEVKEGLIDEAESLSEDLKSSREKESSLKASLEIKEGRIKSLECELQEHAKSRAKLDVETKAAESSLKEGIVNSESLRIKLTECSKKLTTLELQAEKKDLKLEELNKEYESLANEKELYKSRLQMDSVSTAEQLKALRDKNDSFRVAVCNLEEEISRKSFALKDTEETLKAIQKEFASYKLRAQSVLRQSKGSGRESESSSSNNEAAEKGQYERTIQMLNDKLEFLRSKLASSDLDNSHLQEDHDRLMQRYSSLLDEMAAKEIAARHKQDELTALVTKAKANSEETSLLVKLKIEEKVQFYENELQRVRCKHSEEVSKLQKQMDDLNNTLLLLQLSYSQLQERLDSPLSKAEVGPPLFEERVAPEGSVENHSNSFHSRQSPATMSNETSSPMPLEMLLEEEDSKEKTLVRDEVAIMLLDKKISHLSGLLSDSESENHRMAELVEVLKEEIRTYRRSEDRIKHIEHQEYVKNVILKFMTMSDNNERRQLLPVLSKLLVLSPDEIKQIETMLDQPNTESKVEQTAGWSSYFGYLMSSDP